MKIVFATTLSSAGSTNIGRTLPIARLLAVHHQVHVLVLDKNKTQLKEDNVQIHSVGAEPFTRTQEGKKRLKGVALLVNMLSSAIKTAYKITALKPDVLIIVKPLPQNTLGARISRLFFNPNKTILDADDFELSANVTSSALTRTIIHVSERMACNLADSIVVATPFLEKYFAQLIQRKKPINLIPTGIEETEIAGKVGNPQILYAGSLSVSSGHNV